MNSEVLLQMGIVEVSVGLLNTYSLELREKMRKMNSSDKANAKQDDIESIVNVIEDHFLYDKGIFNSSKIQWVK